MVIRSSGRPLRVVYFGTPEFAVPTLRRLLEAASTGHDGSGGHQVVGLISQPDRPKGRGHRLAPTPTKEVALEAGIPVLQPLRLKDDDFLTAISALAPDIGVVAAYGRLIPDRLLNLPPLGMINVHASLLPRWRGAAPVHRAVIAGDRETGVTIMRVVTELDAGASFKKVRRPIDPDETSVDVERDLSRLGADLLLEVLADIAGGRATETPQDDSQATLAPKVTKAEGAVEWSLPAERIHNLVRGLQPWPLVSARIGDSRVLIHRTALTTALSPDRPGTIVRAEPERFEIVAGDGHVLQLLAVQPEGRRIMSAREFLAGRHVRPGERLERG
jgi:methionyl-tRNA formyltransferase